MRTFAYAVIGLLFLTACSADVSDEEAGKISSETALTQPRVSVPSLTPPPSDSSYRVSVRSPCTEDGLPLTGKRGDSRTCSESWTTQHVTSSTYCETYRWCETTTTIKRKPTGGRTSVSVGGRPVRMERLVPEVSVSTNSFTCVQEFAPGAFCRVYRMGGDCTDLKTVFEALNAGAVVLDQGYDVASTDFDGKVMNKHDGDLVVWEGFLMIKRAGDCTFLLSDGGNLVHVTIGDMQLSACATGKEESCTVNLAKGPNRIQILVRETGGAQATAPTLRYRRLASDKPPKKITPAMLCHTVDEDEEW